MDGSGGKGVTLSCDWNGVCSVVIFYINISSVQMLRNSLNWSYNRRTKRKYDVTIHGKYKVCVFKECKALLM